MRNRLCSSFGPSVDCFYENKPVEKEKIKRLIEAARAPTGNIQPVEWLVLTDKAQLAAMTLIGSISA